MPESVANTSNWMGESLIEVLSIPLDGAGLGERVRSVDSLSGCLMLSRECERLCLVCKWIKKVVRVAHEIKLKDKDNDKDWKMYLKQRNLI